MTLPDKGIRNIAKHLLDKGFLTGDQTMPSLGIQKTYDYVTGDLKINCVNHTDSDRADLIIKLIGNEWDKWVIDNRDITYEDFILGFPGCGTLQVSCNKIRNYLKKKFNEEANRITINPLPDRGGRKHKTKKNKKKGKKKTIKRKKGKKKSKKRGKKKTVKRKSKKSRK
jgi:hypothetical protein